MAPELYEKKDGRGKTRIQPYVWICLGIIVAFLIAVYCGGKAAISGRTLHILTGPLDAKIPFVPEWIAVYCSAYLVWVISALWLFSEDRSNAYRLTAGVVLAFLLSGIVFVAWPGTLQRPEISGDGVFQKWVRLIYSADTPTNLCPSFHVMLSYYCWRGMACSRRTPGWAHWCSFFYLILVCVSVLLVKQHALVDIPAAVLIGELSFRAADRWQFEKILYWIEKTLKGSIKGT